MDEPINFKDILRTIEAGFEKNLRTTEAHFDFTGPYKKKSVFFPTVPIPCQPKPTIIMFFSSTPRQIIISLMSSILRGESSLLKNKNLSCLQCFTFFPPSSPFFPLFFFLLYLFLFFLFFFFLLGPLPGPLSPRAPRICLGCLGLVAPLLT